MFQKIKEVRNCAEIFDTRTKLVILSTACEESALMSDKCWAEL